MEGSAFVGQWKKTSRLDIGNNDDGGNGGGMERRLGDQ